jgi:hypothetical protein
MHKKYIGVTSGMSGYFAVLYDAEGPIQTGIGRYNTKEEAEEEARGWSIADNIPLEPNLIAHNKKG